MAVLRGLPGGPAAQGSRPPAPIAAGARLAAGSAGANGTGGEEGPPGSAQRPSQPRIEVDAVGGSAGTGLRPRSALCHSFCRHGGHGRPGSRTGNAEESPHRFLRVPSTAPALGEIRPGWGGPVGGGGGVPGPAAPRARRIPPSPGGSKATEFQASAARSCGRSPAGARGHRRSPAPSPADPNPRSRHGSPAAHFRRQLADGAACGRLEGRLCTDRPEPGGCETRGHGEQPAV